MGMPHQSWTVTPLPVPPPLQSRRGNFFNVTISDGNKDHENTVVEVLLPRAEGSMQTAVQPSSRRQTQTPAVTEASPATLVQPTLLPSSTLVTGGHRASSSCAYAAVRTDLGRVEHLTLAHHVPTAGAATCLAAQPVRSDVLDYGAWKASA
jgi:hypothetical protein